MEFSNERQCPFSSQSGLLAQSHHPQTCFFILNNMYIIFSLYCLGRGGEIIILVFIMYVRALEKSNESKVLERRHCGFTTLHAPFPLNLQDYNESRFLSFPTTVARDGSKRWSPPPGTHHLKRLRVTFEGLEVTICLENLRVGVINLEDLKIADRSRELKDWCDQSRRFENSQPVSMV